MGKANNMFVEYWLSRSNSTFLVPPTNEVFPEIQFKRNARRYLPSPCSNENYLMIIKNLHEMAGGMSTPSPRLSSVMDGVPEGYGDDRSGTIKPCMTKEIVNPTLVTYFVNHKPRYATMTCQLEIKLRPDLITLMTRKKLLPLPPERNWLRQ